MTVNKSGTGSGIVTSFPSGIDCGLDCSETYNFKTSVTLTATPATGSTFTGWSGDASGSTNPVTLIMNGNKNVTAKFILLETISAPFTPTGPTSGTTNNSYSYTAGGSTSSLGHSVEYQFDWKGDVSDLSPWGSLTQSKTWTSAGTYSVKARARCTTDTFVVSSWSGALLVNIETISTPGTLSGPTTGATGAPYSYTTGGSTSSLGHLVEYQFDWKGDGSDLSPWGSATQSKTWGAAGTYNVRTRARCSVDTSVVSGWFAGLSVTISGSTQTTPCTVATDPSGLQIIVDSTSYAAPHTFDWTPGSSHTLSVTSPQSGTSGTRYVYSSWSDGGAQSHTITAPSTPVTYTAYFTTQYVLTTSANPTQGTITVSPIGQTACMTLVAGYNCYWYNSGLSVNLTASPYSSHTFKSWSGDLTGTQNPVIIVMNGPKNITANFSLASRKTPTDFDGDGKTDVTIWRPENGYWYILGSSQGLDHVQWGADGDIPVPGDYDGDGKTDTAVWRPSRCYWYIIRSSDGVVTYTLWGAAGDIPLTGDYDGDGKSDIVIWRPSNGYWYIINSSDQSVDYVQWGGVLNDIPISQ